MRCYVFFTPFKYVDIFLYWCMSIPHRRRHTELVLSFCYFSNTLSEREKVLLFFLLLRCHHHHISYTSSHDDYHDHTYIYLPAAYFFYLFSLKYVTRKKSCMSCHQTQREEKDNKYVKYFQKNYSVKREMQMENYFSFFFTFRCSSQVK